MIDRVAAILETVARAPRSLSLTELADQLDAPVSSIQSLVNGLVAVGYLDEQHRRFGLGPGPYLLNLLDGGVPTQRVTSDDLRQLRTATALGVTLGIAVGDAVYYIDSAGHEPMLRYVTHTHLPRPKIRSSIGRVLLATGDERDMWDYLNRLPSADTHLIDDFLRDLPTVRAHDVAYNPGLADNGYAGVAVVVREPGRRPIGVAITGQVAEVEARREELTELLLHARDRWENRPSSSTQ